MEGYIHIIQGIKRNISNRKDNTTETMNIPITCYLNNTDFLKPNDPNNIMVAKNWNDMSVHDT